MAYGHAQERMTRELKPGKMNYEVGLQNPDRDQRQKSVHNSLIVVFVVVAVDNDNIWAGLRQCGITANARQITLKFKILKVKLY